MLFKKHTYNRYFSCKRIRDACIYPYKINVAQYYP